MKTIYDLQVDNGDDIIISDDIDIDINPINSTIRVAERRISARYDDFINYACGAGLEEYLNKRINSNTKSEIETAIRTALHSEGLLMPAEYDVHVIDLGTNKLQIVIVFKFSGSIDDMNVSTFKVMVNLQNQRSYK